MIRIVVEPARFDVTPGSPIALSVGVHNDGSAPQTVALRLVGLDPEWVEWPDDGRLVVPAGVTVEVPTRVTLPGGFPAGAQLIGVEATVEGVLRPALASLELVVASVDGVSFGLTPASFSGGRKGKFRINVMNRGAQPITLRISGRASGVPDPSAASPTTRGASKRPELEFTFKPDEIELRPGDRVRARGVVRGRRPTIGAPRTRAMTIVAQGNSAPIYADGRFTQRPLLSRRTLKVFGLFVVLSMWAGALLGAVNFSEQQRDEQAAADASAELDEALQEEAEAAEAAEQAAEGGDDEVMPGEDAAATGSTLSGTVTGLPDRAGVTVSARSVGLTEPADGTEVIAQSKSQTTGKLFGQSVGVEGDGDSGPYTTVTESDGTWHLAGLPFPANYQVTLSKAGFGTRSFLVSVDESNPNVELDVEMAAGDGSISGTVNGPDGPLGGVTLTVTDGTITFTTTTPTSGDVGTWSVGGLATPGSYLVTASLRGYGTETLGVQLGGEEDRTGADVTLARGVGSIGGVVGNGLDGIGGILVTAASETVTRSVTTLTDDPVGSYQIPQLPIPGTYTVTVTGDGWIPQTEQIVLDGNQSGVDYELKGTTSSVSGVVTDEDGPLAAVGVTVSQDEPLVKTLTDDDGAFNVEGLQPGTYTVTFERFGFETQSTIVSLVAGEPKDDVTIELVATDDTATTGDATIKGIVRSGTTGDPIGAVTVKLGTASVQTDPGGTFTLEGLPAGTFDIELTHARHQTTARTVRIGVKANLTVDITMLPLGGLQGQVTDLTATAIPGVSVAVAAQTGTAPVTVPAVVTDANGEYSILESLPTGSYTATFTMAGFGSQTREFEASAGSVSVADVQLVELATITGAIQEPGGGVGGFLSLSNVTVKLEKIATGGALTTVYGPAVVSGSYSVTSLLPGDYRVTVTHPDFTEIGGALKIFTRDLIGVKLREIRDGGMVLTKSAVPGAVSGQVFFAAGATRSGIVGATITAQIVTGFSILPTFPFVTPQLQTVTVQSIANGAVIPGSSPARTATIDGYWEMSPPPVPGSVSNYTASAAGFIQKTLAVTSPTASGSGDFQMLAEPQTVTGTVTLSNAAPTVVVLATMTSTSLTAPLTQNVTTDASGVAAYSFPGLSPGSYTITLTAVGYHTGTDTVTLPTGASAGTVPAGNTTLQQQSTINVTVKTNTTSGAVVSAADVTIDAEPADPNFTSQTITTGSSGVASFTGLAARTYRITVVRGGYNTSTSAAVSAFPVIADEVLAVGEVAAVTVPLQKHPDLTVNITGQLADLASVDTFTALDNATVTMTPVGGGAVITLGLTTTAGRYFTESLQPGDYRLTITAPLHEAPTPATLTMAAGSNITRNEVLVKLPTIIVNLDKRSGGVSSDFLVADGVATVVATPTVGGSPITLTRTTGTATFTGLAVPTGTYSITGSAAGYASDTESLANVLAGTTRDVTLELDQFANLVIQVNDVGGNPLDADSVTVTPTGGTAIPVAHTGTANSGTYEAASVSPGAYAVTVLKTSYVVGTANLTVTAGLPASTTITLREYPDALVTVVDAGANPINTADVSAAPIAGGAPVLFTATGANGEYTALDVPTGAYTLSATAPGFASTTGVAGNFQSTTLGTISGTTTLTLTIASSITVNAYENVQVVSVVDDPGTGPDETVIGTELDDATVILRSVGGTNPTSRQRFTGDDGAGKAVFNELTPVTAPVYYKLTISKLGYQTVEVDNISLATGASVIANVVLKRYSLVTVSVQSHITGSADTGLAGATVTAGPVPGAASAGAVPTVVAATVGSGAYYFPGLAPGTYRITATAPNHVSSFADVTLVAGVDPATTTLTLNRYSRLTATVRTQLDGTTTDLLASSALATVTATNTSSGDVVSLASDGTATATYSVAVIEPGTYTVSVSAPNHASNTASSTVAAGTNQTATVVLAKHPTVTVHVNSRVNGANTDLGTATVTATLPGGSAIPLAFASSGDYTRLLAPGTYALAVSAAGHDANTGSVTVVAGTTPGTETVNLFKQPKLTITVVSSVSATALTNATVTAALDGGGASIDLEQVGSTNVYEVDAVPFGVYDVTVSAPNHASGSTSVTVVQGTDKAQTVTLTRHASLTVTVQEQINGGAATDLLASAAAATVTAVNTTSGDVVSLASDGSSTATYAASAIQPGSYSVSVAAPGHDASTGSVTVVAGTPAALTVALFKHPKLTITVVSSVATAALTNATVTAAPNGGGASIDLEQVGSTNVYEADAVTSGVYDVTVSAPNHATSVTAVTVVQGTDKAQTITLTKASTLQITVKTKLDGDSTPNDLAFNVTPATVTAQETTTGEVVSLTSDGASTATYSVTAIQPGTYIVTASAANHVSASSTSITMNAGTNDTDDEIVLNAYPTLTVDVDGDPLGGGSTSQALSGVTVTAQLTAGGPAITIPETTTAGTYRISSLPPGVYTVSASKSGWSTVATQSVTATAGLAITDPEFDLIELPTITVTVRSDVVVDTSHVYSPLTSASVVADPQSAGSNVTLTHTANGVYTGVVSVGGVWDITASATGHTNGVGSATVTLGSASPGNVAIDLVASTGTISGTVRDITGAAINGVTVTRFGHGITPVTTTTASGGTYSFTPVPALTWEVSFAFDGVSPLTISPTVPKGGTVTADAVLAPIGASIFGRSFVVASDAVPVGPGNPRTGLAGVTVALSGGSDTRADQTTVTNGLGDFYYLFSDLQPDTDYVLTFSKTNYQTVVVSNVSLGNAALVTADVTMVPTARTVTINATNAGGGFVSGATIRITNANLLASPGYKENLVATTGGGAATISSVPPGTYTVSVTTTPSGFATPAATCSSGAACTTSTTLTVTAGADPTLNIAFTASGSASGTVVLNDDAAALSVGNDGGAAGATVTVSKGGYSQAATVAAAGTWSMSSIPQDSGYTFTFSLSGYRTLTVSSQTISGSNLALGTRTLDKLSTLAVTVVDGAGAAVAADTIGLFATDGVTRINDDVGSASASGSGTTYTFEGLTPGTEVHVRSTKTGYFQTVGVSKTLLAGENAGSEGLTVTLRAQATVNVNTDLGGTETATFTFSWTAATGLASTAVLSLQNNPDDGIVQIPSGVAVSWSVVPTPGTLTFTVNAAATTDALESPSPATFTVTAGSTSTLEGTFA